MRLFANEKTRCTGTEGSALGRRRPWPQFKASAMGEFVKCRNLPAGAHVVG